MPESDASRQQRGLFNKKVAAEVTLTSEICTQAKRPEYDGELTKKKIDANFIWTLLVLAELTRRKGEMAVQARKPRAWSSA